MAYRDDRQALEQRRDALQIEIAELLDALDELEAEGETKEREEFWKRAANHPEVAVYDRPSLAALRPFIYGAAFFFGLIALIAVMADNPIGERIAAVVMMTAFLGLFVGVAYAIVSGQRRRSVDARCDGDGLHIDGAKVTSVHAWHDVERLRLRVQIHSSNNGGRSRTGILALRIDDVWTEYTLDGISVAETEAFNLWVDWVLGVAVASEGEENTNATAEAPSSTNRRRRRRRRRRE